MTTYQDLLKIKDSYARAWTFMNAAANGGVQNCYYVAPQGAIYRLSECTFGKTHNGYALMVNGGGYVLHMEPGNVYRIAESDIYSDCVLDVTIDDRGNFHILKDTAFKVAGCNTYTAKQIESHCNNRNLCDSVALFRQVGVVPESIYVRNRDLIFTENKRVELSFANQTMSVPIDEFDGFELFNEVGKSVRKYWRVQNLYPMVEGSFFYVDDANPLKPREQDVVSGLLGELMLALYGDPEGIQFNFELLETMSKETADLYFLYNNGLLICDRQTGEQMLVPNDPNITLFSRIDSPDRCVCIDNSGAPQLLSNSI